MRGAAAHRAKLLLDTKGHEHPILKEPGKPLYWNRVLRYVSVVAHRGFATFDEIVEQINALAGLLKEHGAKIKPDQPLPAEVVWAFENLHVLLDETKCGLVGDLRLSLPASPPLREFCFRQPQDPRTPMIQIGYDWSCRVPTVTRLMPLFDMLFNERKLSLFGLHTLTDEIGRLLQSDSEI